MGNTIERWLRALAPHFGFRHFDEEHTRRGVRIAGALVLTAWALLAAAPWIGLGSAIAALALATLVCAVVAGSALTAAQTNEELATLLVTSMAQAEQTPAAPRPAASPPPLPAVTPLAPPRAASEAGIAVSAERPQLMALPMGPDVPPQLLSEGDFDGRRYSLYSDGSIEMETMFGPRWFASLEVAHEFIGYRDGAPDLAREFEARLN